MKGVLIFGVDDRAKPGVPFDVSKARFEFKADNGAVRTYLGSFVRGEERREMIEDEYGAFLGKARASISFALPNGEHHHFDLLRELEVTEDTKKVEVVAASMSATPKVSPYRG